MPEPHGDVVEHPHRRRRRSTHGLDVTRRRQHNLTVLADGSVLATGGQKTNGGGGLVDLANAVYTAERWNPATGAWTELAAAAVARQYHSTSRSCSRTGGCSRAAAASAASARPGRLPAAGHRGLHAAVPLQEERQRAARAAAGADRRARNARLRRRVHAHSPQAATSASSGSSDSARRRTARTRASATCPLPFTKRGTTLTVAAPNNPNEAPAGHYMLFAVDAAGVPSMAAIVQVQRPAVTATAACRSTSRSTGPPPAAPRAPAPKAPRRPSTAPSRAAGRQVLLEGVIDPLPGGRPRLEPHGHHLRGQARRRRRRVDG